MSIHFAIAYVSMQLKGNAFTIYNLTSLPVPNWTNEHPSDCVWTFVVPVLRPQFVPSAFFTFGMYGVGLQSQHGHIQYPWMLLCYFVFAFNLDCKVTSFSLFAIQKVFFLVMSSHVFKTLIKSVLYSCWFISATFVSFDFPNSLCYTLSLY